MREVLIRYLLGELDADERQDVQARLQSSPELREELARLRSCFAAHQNEGVAEAAPPTGLAARTAERVTGGEDVSGSNAARPTQVFGESGDPPVGILGWSLADLTVAGGVMLAVSMLLFPALRNSREGTRLNGCEYGMHQILVLSTRYADDHGNFFPEIGQKEHAGAVVARLIERGYIKGDDIAILLVCPSSPLADKIRSRSVVLRPLPTAEQLQAMSNSQREQFTATALPCHAFTMPQRIHHKYQLVKNDHSPLTPVLSDATGDGTTSALTPNHNGAVIQVQFAAGNTRRMISWKLLDDDLSHNDLGFVAAGVRKKDFVLGNSKATPGEEPAEQGNAEQGK